MSERLQEQEIFIERSKAVEPAEIVGLRAADGPDAILETEGIWRECVDQSLCTVTAREPATNELIGIGFVIGNLRHAQLVDLSVKPEYREKGIGAQVGKELLDYVEENNIRYVGLTYDKTKPWLKSWYESAGFEEIDFAMWLKRSIGS
jgi:ribosomal protein S18 acetylase RimI-like enzyme